MADGVAFLTTVARQLSASADDDLANVTTSHRRGWLALADDLVDQEPDFNDPEHTRTRAAWTDLQRLTNDVIDFALTLKREPAPVRLIATHRTLVRGTLLFASAFVGFLTPLTAPTILRRLHPDESRPGNGRPIWHDSRAGVRSGRGL